MHRSSRPLPILHIDMINIINIITAYHISRCARTQTDAQCYTYRDHRRPIVQQPCEQPVHLHEVIHCADTFILIIIRDSCNHLRAPVQPHEQFRRIAREFPLTLAYGLLPYTSIRHLESKSQ